MNLGWGCCSVRPVYLLKRHTIDTTTTVAGLLGAKFPTGNTDGKTEDGADFLDAHLQLGTGSTSPTAHREAETAKAHRG